MWLNHFKIALVQRDTDKLDKLMETLPELKSQSEIQEALHLLKEATDLVTELKDDTQKSMVQMKKNITFLKATENKRTSQFDIKS